MKNIIPDGFSEAAIFFLALRDLYTKFGYEATKDFFQEALEELNKKQ